MAPGRVVLQSTCVWYAMIKWMPSKFPPGDGDQCHAGGIAPPGVVIKLNPLQRSFSVCHILGTFHTLPLIIIKISQENVIASKLLMENLSLKEVKPWI